MSGLPAGWEAVGFDDAVDVISDRGFRIQQKEYLSSGELPIVDQGDGVIGGYTNQIDAAVNSDIPVIVFGDHTRRFKFINFAFAVGADGVKIFAPTKLWKSEFLFLQFSNIDLADRGYGRHFQHLRKLPLLLPPAAEQTRIVAKLDALLTELDAGVAQLKAAQKKLVQYRQSLLKSAVEGTLTAEWRTQQTQPQETGEQLLERILTERRSRWQAKQLKKYAAQGKPPPKDWQSKYPEPVKPDTTDLPALPQGWVWASLDQLSEIQGGIQKQPSRAPVTNKFPFLRVANVARGLLKLDEVHEIELFNDELERLRLQLGDILIVEGNGSLSEIGRCAIWNNSIKNAVHQNHLIRARPVLMDSQFVESWLNSLGGIDKLTKLAATTSGLYTLSVGKISKIPVPVSPLTEQVSAIKTLKECLQVQFDQLESINTALKQSAAQRKNILKAAFAGELVPQDPSDEPASALLARIAAQRASHAALNKGGKVRQTRRVSA